MTNGFPVPTTAAQHSEQWNPAPARGDIRALGLHTLRPRHENGPPDSVAGPSRNLEAMEAGSVFSAPRD